LHGTVRERDKVMRGLKREESIALVDKNDCLWELSKNKKGRYVVRRLRDKKHGT
jgi:hypothetical protein